jgi:hypothetical protein
LKENLEVIICLLEHGADVNMKTNVSIATYGLVVMVEMVIVVGEG